MPYEHEITAIVAYVIGLVTAIVYRWVCDARATKNSIYEPYDPENAN